MASAVLQDPWQALVEQGRLHTTNRCHKQVLLLLSLPTQHGLIQLHKVTYQRGAVLLCNATNVVLTCVLDKIFALT
jgi:hypothetical protein